MALTVDTRTATEYGVVRTFGQADFQFTHARAATPSIRSTSPASPSAGTNTQPAEPARRRLCRGRVCLHPVRRLHLRQVGFRLCVALAGFPGQHLVRILLGGQNTDTGVNNIQYTAQFGNGVSGTIGLDDPIVWDRTSVYNLALPLNATLGGSNAYARRPRA